MNIKFEWVKTPGIIALDEGASYHCWLGKVCVGMIHEYGREDFFAAFGDNIGKARRAIAMTDIPTLDEAKAWVEEQARAWLAEVTA